METKHEERMKTMKSLKRDFLLYKGSQILTESIKDPDVTPEEHKQLFRLFLDQVQTIFPEPSGTEIILIRQICFSRHSKEEVKKQEIKTLYEILQRQIDVGDIYDATGKIVPETLWGIICFRYPEYKEQYDLNSEYDWEEGSMLKYVIIEVSSGLAMWSQRTKHLRR